MVGDGACHRRLAIAKSTATLTIEPGTIVKLDLVLSASRCHGTLTAVGSAGQFIVFTSTSDDTVGEDLTAQATTAVPWQSDAIWINSATTVLDHTEIRYAGNRAAPGNGNWRTPAVHLNQSATLRSVTIADSENQGLLINSGTPLLEDLLVERSGSEAIYMKVAADPTFTGACASDNEGGDRVTLEAGSVTADQHWEFSGLPVHWTDDIGINAGVTVTVEPGTVMKLPAGAHLDVGGVLLANGTAAAPIIFTSIRDDAHGGDTNADDPERLPLPGDWNAIGPKSTASRLDHVEIWYAGNQASPGNGNWRTPALHVLGVFLSDPQYVHLRCRESVDVCRRRQIGIRECHLYGWCGAGCKLPPIRRLPT